jgi:hypothetical protein
MIDNKTEMLGNCLLEIIYVGSEGGIKMQSPIVTQPTESIESEYLKARLHHSFRSITAQQYLAPKTAIGQLLSDLAYLNTTNYGGKEGMGVSRSDKKIVFPVASFQLTNCEN